MAVVENRMLVALILLVAVGPIVAAPIEYRGAVVDAERGEPLPNVYLIVSQRVVGVSAADGSYRFSRDGPLAGAIKFTLVGFHDQQLEIAGRPDGATVTLDTVRLVPAPVMIDGITVTAHRGRPVSERHPTEEVIADDDFLEAPGALNDLSRAIQTLPSVTAISDYRGDLVVRGGNPAEGVVMVEGFEVANINHFGVQGSTGGPFGIIPADNVRKISLMPGGFSVRYPNRLSSAMVVDLKGANEISAGGEVRVDPAGIGVSFNAAAPRRHRYLLATIRRSYLEAVEEQLDMPATPVFGDLLLKGGYLVEGSRVLSLLGLYAVDRFSLPHGESELVDGALENDQTRGVLGLKLTSLAGPHSLWEAKYTFGYDLYDVSFEAASSSQLTGNWSVERSHRFSLSYTVAGGQGNELDAGVSFKHSDGDYRLRIINYRDNFGVVHAPLRLEDAMHVNEAGVYLEFTSQFSEHTAVRAGLRYDRHSVIDDAVVCPRLAVTQRLGLNLSFAFSGGIFAQPPSMLWLVSDHNNLNLPYFEANHLIAGLEWLPRISTRLKLEAYRKIYPSYPVDGYWRVKTMVDYGTEFRYYDTRRIWPHGHGYARGIELTVNHEPYPGLSLMVGGSLHTSRFDANYSELPGAFDTEYSVATLVSYQPFGPLQLTLRYRGAGGRPYTPIHTLASETLGMTIWDRDRINEERYPPYQRLDIKVNLRLHLLGGKLNAYVDILNVFDRENPHFKYWSVEEGRIMTYNQIGKLPLAGVLFEW